MKGRIVRGSATSVLFLLTLVFLFLPLQSAQSVTINVSGFTSADVQSSVTSAAPGDTVFLPGGVYDFTTTVTIDKALTIRGAGHLQNVGVPEYGPVGSDIPPTWSETPSDCYASTDAVTLFNVITSNGVTFENLKLTGRTISTAGTNRAIDTINYSNIRVIGCEVTAHENGIRLYNSYNNIVAGCYIHGNVRSGSNLGAGVDLRGTSNTAGGAQAIIRDSEFKSNRQDVRSRSPLTRFVFYRNYSHDNTEGDPSVVIGTSAGTTQVGVVRDNIFVRARPLLFNSGLLNITGNFFDVTCSDTVSPGLGYSRMIDFNASSVETDDINNTYLGENVNESGRPEVTVGSRTFSGVTYWAASNTFINGVYWGGAYPANQTKNPSPKPILGNVWVTEAGTSTRVFKIENDTWYDLHVMAVDPQGADNIARIGIQLRNPDLYPYIPGNATGEFRADGNYFIETDGTDVYVRKTEGSSDWTAVEADTQDLYVDTNHFQYTTNGSERKRFVIRFRILGDADVTVSDSHTGVENEWIINGYVRDADDNLPHERILDTQEGWFIGVTEKDDEDPGEPGTITVDAFTSDAIQEAVDSAIAGSVIVLPAGVYDFTNTVMINKAITIIGAAQLQNLNIPEYGPIGSDIPPTWSGIPSELYADSDSLSPLFDVLTSDGVVFKNLKLTGRTTSTEGSNNAVNVNGYDNVTIIGCQITAMQHALVLANSSNNLVKDCYINHNIRTSGRGIYLMDGAQVVVRDNEFMANRNDLYLGGTDAVMSFAFIGNYTHDNEPGNPCVHVHYQVSPLTRGIIRDNIFVRTRPIFAGVGSYEITGNFFDASCGIVPPSGYGYSRMIDFPASASYPVESAIHNSYVYNNINNSGRTYVQVSSAQWDVTRYSTYNLYIDGVLFESVNTTHQPRAVSPEPLFGEAYFTRLGDQARLKEIENDRWYDLHFLACDPQGAGDIARIGIQIRNPNKYDYDPGNDNGKFWSDGNYFIETDGDSVYIRMTEGYSEWTTVEPSTEGLFVDANHFQYYIDGSHRKHFIIRFKLPADADLGDWVINGYARDADGNLPHPSTHDNQFGWHVNVTENTGGDDEEPREPGTITVGAFTSAAVQAAVDSAVDGDVIFLPAGRYIFTNTVTINKAITLLGAAELEDVGVVEYGTTMSSNIPPEWSATPSECWASTNSLTLFSVTTSKGVRFENLKLTGQTTVGDGSNVAISISGYNNLQVIGCEISDNQRGVYLRNSYNNLVRGCYIHHNRRSGLGYGVSITGTSMLSGGSQVIIRDNEFMANRHNVATNSPNTSFIIYRNYSHSNDDPAMQPDFESHVQGLNTLRGVVRDNVFVRTRPLAYKSGSLEISGNFFDISCGVIPSQGGLGYSNMCIFGVPTHNAVYVEGAELHNIYFGGNINNSGRPEVVNSSYEYGGVRKWVTYNLYHNGVLWESVNTTYPPFKTDPRPLLGEVYITEAGTTDKVHTISKNKWYDLHAMAVDPQGANDIARVGIQLRNPDLFDYSIGNENGEFSASGNYFIETDGENVYVRKTEGSSDWTIVPSSSRDLYVDTNHFQYVTNGSHRKRFTIRFRLPEDAVVGSCESHTGLENEWVINGYVVDRDGNLPHTQAYDTQEGWFVEVEEGFGESGEPEVKTVAEAAMAGWINMYAYMFDGEDYIIVNPMDPEQDTEIGVLKGFWMGINDDVDLLIPLAEEEPDVPDSMSMDLSKNQWHLVSFPLDPGEGNRDIGSYLSPFLGVNETDWRAAKWDHTSKGTGADGYSIYPEELANMAFPRIWPGRAFWIKHTNDTDIVVPLAGDIPERPSSGYWELGLLAKGDGNITPHMIGNPFWYPIDWKDLKVSRPYRGTNPAGKIASAPSSVEKWHVGIKLYALEGTARDMYNRAGVVLTPEIDSAIFNALDLVPPTNWVNVNLKDPSDENRNGLAYDFRAGGENQYVWELNLSTSFESVPVQLTFDDFVDVPDWISFTLHKVGTEEVLPVEEDSFLTLTLTSDNVEKYLLIAEGVPPSVEERTPLTFGIKSASPNPFNPVTTIRFDIVERGDVRLRVYSITGQLVATLADRTMEPGNHSIAWNASRYASGVYLVVIESAGKRDVRSVTLMK